MNIKRKNISIEKELVEEIDILRKAERPALSFSLFVARTLWRAVKEMQKEQAKEKKD